MKKYLNYAIVAAVALLVGRYVLQPKPVEVIKWKEKIVEVKVEDKKKKIVKKETTSPDGTKVVDTTVTEDTVSNTNTQKETKLDTVRKTGSGLTLGLLASKTIGDFDKTNMEAVAVVPFFGNLKFVGSVTTAKQVGIGLALEF